jgi:hypothetical protein
VCFQFICLQFYALSHLKKLYEGFVSKYSLSDNGSRPAQVDIGKCSALRPGQQGALVEHYTSQGMYCVLTTVLLIMYFFSLLVYICLFNRLERRAGIRAS